MSINSAAANTAFDVLASIRDEIAKSTEGTNIKGSPNLIIDTAYEFTRFTLTAHTTDGDFVVAYGKNIEAVAVDFISQLTPKPQST